jgi:hypothetical protein
VEFHPYRPTPPGGGSNGASMGGVSGSGALSGGTTSTDGAAETGGDASTSDASATGGTGGDISTGGANGTGGDTSTGGTSGTGGGDTSTGGTSGTGGDTSTGDASATGGTSTGGASTGGTSGSGGDTSTGGTSATGGNTSTGGASTGGTSTGGSNAGPTCTDGITNGLETGQDCGGPDCQPCGTGTPCKTSRDCASKSCVGRVCAAPNCADGIQNGDEASVDCGGSCPAKCVNGSGCASPNDCASGQCSGGKCTATTCSALGLPGTAALPIPDFPLGLALGDMDGDGALDAVAAPGPIVFRNDGKGLFGPGENENVPAWRVATGDLDGNGRADIVAVGQFDSSVMLNQGGGTFTRVPITQPNGNAFTRPAVADVDGDGKLDIAYGTSDVSTHTDLVSILFNLGNGSFGSRVDLATPHFVFSVALSDANGDGKLDVVAGNSTGTTSKLSVMLNQGNRSFGAISSYPVPTAREIAIGDFDQNGTPDVAAVGANRLAIIFNSGGGVYGSAVEYYARPAPSGPPYSNTHQNVATADIDGDGKLDLVVTSESAISVRRNVGGGEFGPNTDYAATVPTSLALGDVDKDGRADIVYTGPAGLIAMVNRNGTFAALTEYGLGPGRDSLTGGPTAQARLADVDGDGQLDFVSVENGDEVAVRLRTPGGGLGPRVTYPTAPGARNVLAADLDGDGHPELVVGTEQGAVSVLPNVGAGAFGPHEDRTVGTSWTAIAAGDFDGDGAPDLAASDCASGTASVLLNLGALTFGAKVGHDAGLCPRALAQGDLDRDGNLDLVVANVDASGPGGVSVLFNQGQAAFAAPVDYESGEKTMDVAVADLNADGAADVVAASFFTARLSVFLNQGDGTLGARSSYATPSNPIAVAVADLDRDGKPDLVAADQYNVSQWLGDIGLFRNLGSGTFASAVRLGQAFEPANSSVAIGDLDGDQNADLVVSDIGGIAVHVGNGDFTFEDPAYADFYSFSNSITAGDLDGDGKQEIVAGGGVAEFGTFATILHNQGGGRFGDRFQLPTPRVPMPIVVADLDGDGVRDMATAETIMASSGQQSGRVGVYLNRGGSGFDAAWYSTSNLTPDPRGVAVGDLNGDGRPDIAAADDYDMLLAIFFNQGVGRFGAAVKYPAAHPTAVAMADVDGNGTLDVLTLDSRDALFQIGSSAPGKRVSLHLNDGNGSLTVKGTPLLLPDSPQTMAVDDLDGDGKVDVVVSVLDKLCVFHGLGGGQFASRVDYTLTFTPLGIAIADLDGDGLKDVAVTGKPASTGTTVTVRVFRGTGNGALSSYAEYPAARSAQGITAADLDGDGRLDLATTGYPRISVLLNRCW